MFLIGIAPRKGSHTAAVLDDAEHLVGQCEASFWYAVLCVIAERRVGRVGVDRATRRWVTVRACRADCLGAR